MSELIHSSISFVVRFSADEGNARAHFELILSHTEETKSVNVAPPQAHQGYNTISALEYKRIDVLHNHDIPPPLLKGPIQHLRR